jgi:hypothetical protein
MEGHLVTSQLYEGQIARGLLELDGVTMIGVVVDDTYVFQADHATIADIVSYEVSGAGYSRLAGAASATLNPGAWTLAISGGAVDTDLSAVSNRGGVIWAKPGGSDAARNLIAFTDDPGGAVDPYFPAYPDGIVDYPIQSISAIITALQAIAAGAGVTGFLSLLAISDVDGTATDVTILAYEYGATAGGIIPDNYVEQVTFDVATWHGVLTGFVGLAEDQEFKVVVPGAGGVNFGIYSLTPATIGEPWTLIDGDVAVRIDGTWAGLRGLDSFVTVLPVDAQGVVFSEDVGLLALQENVSDALKALEGIMDNWRFGAAVSLDPALDLTDYVGVPTSPQPTLSGGTQPVVGGGVSVFNQAVETDNGYYIVQGDGSWEQSDPPGNLSARGNGGALFVNAPGNVLHGLFGFHFDEDRTTKMRGGGSEDYTDPGTWQVYYPASYIDALEARIAALEP